jgi:DNA-binding XRE family transcriptional regulator
MRTLDSAKLAKLHNTDDLLNRKYGVRGTPTRTAFEEKAMANYYGEIFKERRKELKLTQAQLAERVGKKREYIVLLEKGNTDMQLSTFFGISHALGFKFSLV